MHRHLSFTAGALALGLVIAPMYSFARDEKSIRQGEKPTSQHGVQGAQDAGMAKTPTTAAEFVQHAGAAGMAEVALGKMGAAKASDTDVKEFAQKMVDDHSKANAELTTLANSKNLALPNDVDAKQKAEAGRLNKLSGAAFDKAFMQAMVGDHDHAVGLFDTYSERGDDADLKAWATKTLPTLQEHERLAKATATKVGVTAHAKGGHTAQY